MATPQIESTIEIPPIDAYNVTATHTKEYAIEMAKINTEEDEDGWTYVAEPKNADDPDGRWIIKIYDEDNFFVGFGYICQTCKNCWIIKIYDEDNFFVGWI